MEINLDMIQTITLAVVIYYFGNWVRSKVDFLDRFCIPAPVIGGILFAFLNLIMRESGVLFLNFDTSLQSPAMIVFFTTVGLGASLELLTSSPPVPIVTNEDSLKKLSPKLSFVLCNDSFGIRPSRP